MADLIQLRRDTAANWTSANPVLSQGEQGYETDTGKMKIGDGSTAWSSLAYFVDPSSYATSSDITTAVAPKANTADLATVATTGAYSDLTGTPTGLATETYVDTAVSNLVDTAPEALNTLNELAAALGDDADFAGTVTTSLAAKANTADLATVATTGAYSDLTGTPTVPTVLTDLNITDGTAGQVLSADGDGTYTFIDAASGGGGGGSFEAVASGSLSDGSTVVLNSDGTVSVVAEEGFTAGPGTPSVFKSDSGQIASVSATFDSANNKVVIAYQDQGNSNYGTAVVGTVSGTSISFGSPVVFESAKADYISATFDSNLNKVVIAYRDWGNSYYGTAVVGTVSGTSISFGTPVVFESANIFYASATFDSNSNKVVIAYADAGNSYYGTSVVGTVSGTSISFETPVVFNSANSGSLSTTFDSANNKVVIAYRDSGNSNYGTAIVGTVSGTSISFGTPAVFDSTSSYEISSTFDSNSNKVVIVYRDRTNSHNVMSVVATVTGTNISVGTPVVIESAGNESLFPSVTFDSANNKVVVTYRGNQSITNSAGTVVVGTVSGTSISFESSSLFHNGFTNYIAATFDSNSNKVVIGYFSSTYSNGVTSYYGTAVVYQTVNVTTTNLTAENYAGIADAAYADAATATIQTAGSVDDAQSGLTPGQAYYVQPNGTLGLTPGTPSVFAGTAVSATKLLIGKEAPAATVAYADVTGTPDLSSYATETYVTTAVNNLVDTAPEALNTLNELAAALGDDADFAGTVTTSLAAKANTADLATVATSGSYNDLTDQPVVAAGGGSFEAVASGTLSNGSTVIVNADGTVSVVQEVGAVAGFSAYSTAVDGGYERYVYAGPGKIVIAYESGGNALAVVGTITASEITFGTPVEYKSGAIDNGGSVVLAYNPVLNSIALFYTVSGTWPNQTINSVVGNISGDTISFNASTYFSNVSWADTADTYDVENDRIIIWYREATTGYGRAAVVSMTSSTATRVSVASFNTSNSDANYATSNIVASYNPVSGNHMVTYTYRLANLTYQDKIKLGYVSGNSISFGSEYATTGAYIGGRWSACHVTGNYMVYAWSNSTGTNGAGNGYVQMRVGSEGAGSGNISYGTTYTVESGTGTEVMVAYDSINNKGVILYNSTNGTWQGRYRTFTVSGTSITFDSVQLRPGGGSTWAFDYRSDPLYFDASIQKVVGRDANLVFTFQTADSDISNLTAENYIGISDGSYSDGATATVQIVGSVDDAQSGLTPGKKYYVQTDGTLATTADDPSVFAGTAVSTTKLIVKG